MWSKGTIGVPLEDGNYTAVNYKVEHFDKPSDMGYERGKAFTIYLQQDGKEVYNFEHGKETIPQTEETMKTLAIVLKEYNWASMRVLAHAVELISYAHNKTKGNQNFNADKTVNTVTI